MAEDSFSTDVINDAQKQNCVFCRIISGEIPAKKIFEDDRCLVILDINPANEGHSLILPKKHYQIMPQIPPEELGYLFNISKKTSRSLLKSFGLQGTSIFVANGVAAGQKSPHFMIHVIPRVQADGLLDIPKNHIPGKELDGIQKAILSKLGNRPQGKAKPEQKSAEPGDEETKEQQETREDADLETLAGIEKEKKEDKGVDIDKISRLFS